MSVTKSHAKTAHVSCFQASLQAAEASLELSGSMLPFAWRTDQRKTRDVTDPAHIKGKITSIILDTLVQKVVLSRSLVFIPSV
jgi:hypothetical protein